MQPITYRVQCPSCGSWAQLRVADPIGPQTAPVVVLYSCLGQMDETHVMPGDAELLKLLPDASGATLT